MTRRAGRAALAAGLGLGLALPTGASATWSITAVDREAREVGIAIASCVGFPLDPAVAIVRGRGVAAVQGEVSPLNRARATRYLQQGGTPAEILTALTDTSRDPAADTRQYGVVTIDGAAAGFTGGFTEPWSGSRATTGVSVQGNLLVGPEVVRRALAAFQGAPRQPLRVRLMRALVGGSRAGGDRRCNAGDRRYTASSALLRVAGPRGGLRVSVVDPLPHRNAVDVLAAKVAPAARAPRGSSERVTRRRSGVPGARVHPPRLG